MVWSPVLVVKSRILLERGYEKVMVWSPVRVVRGV